MDQLELFECSVLNTYCEWGHLKNTSRFFFVSLGFFPQPYGKKDKTSKFQPSELPWTLISNFWPPQLSETTSLCFGVLSLPHKGFGCFLHTKHRGNCRNHMIFFFLRDHDPELSALRCLKTVVAFTWPSFLSFYLFIYFYSRRESPVSWTSSGQGTESPTFIFEL